jgi:hypothetical protein
MTHTTTTTTAPKSHRSTTLPVKPRTLRAVGLRTPRAATPADKIAMRAWLDQLSEPEVRELAELSRVCVQGPLDDGLVELHLHGPMPANDEDDDR